jgi:hypothetical protein
MSYKFRYAVCLLSTVLAYTAFGTDLGQVLADPRRFDKQEVDVVGVARVPGDFYLFQDPSAASEFDESKSAWVLQKTTGRGNFQFDRQWVRVTGVVDANAHGRGLSRCVIVLNHVEPVLNRLAPRIKDSNIYGLFHNATSKEIHVELFAQNKGAYTEFWIEPGGTNGGAEIHEGELVATALQGKPNVPVWERQSGEIIAKSKIKFPKFAPDYEYSAADSDERTLYYRITDGKIELVPGSEARTWKR